MKKIVVLLAMALLVSGCAVQKHCFIRPYPNQEFSVPVGGRMVEKAECYGRVTVNDCSSDLWLVFLGKNGSNIRIQSSTGTATINTTGGGSTIGGIGKSGYVGVWSSSSTSKAPIITELLYPESAKFIEFQDIKIEIIEVTENRITFKLLNISTQGCNKVNGQEVNNVPSVSVPLPEAVTPKTETPPTETPKRGDLCHHPDGSLIEENAWCREHGW